MATAHPSIQNTELPPRKGAVAARRASLTRPPSLPVAIRSSSSSRRSSGGLSLPMALRRNSSGSSPVQPPLAARRKSSGSSARVFPPVAARKSQVTSGMPTIMTSSHVNRPRRDSSGSRWNGVRLSPGRPIRFWGGRPNQSLCATFIPCILACHVAEEAGESCCLPCLPGSLIALRTDVRARYHIQGSICEDWVVMTCCPLCGLCQLSRQLNKR
ncbi:uncharacterized protein LOC128332772 isoform X4 [Hemicordylus capensis]|uniref:uncharacterized protein LOC128332772 isoform X4 n=1 Tax=Hemicordylus capensis TaxID=884348 RepID=UPI00230329F8|nr:uncharacterized protein LOC128332772 isoform X4 [Hemicordylus capensis]